MKKLAIIFAILLQAAALGWVVFERESVLRNGTVVYLRTAPIDPNDVMRGDYVRLAYDINRIPRSLADAQLLAQKDNKEQRVYASLSVDKSGIARVTALQTQPPSEGLFLRGYTSDDWQLRGNSEQIAVKFGIEKLFVEQGAGKLIEQQRGSRNDWQTPMEVAVAVGSNGIGVIRDHRWAQLAMRMELLNPQPATGGNTPFSPRLRFSIRNQSTEPLALANAGNDCSYALLPADSQSFTLANNECANVIAGSADIIVLAPGEIYARELDLAQPRWHIRATVNNKETFVGEVGHFNGWQRFRVVYQSPANAATLSTAQAPQWQGTVSSPAFSNRGRVD